MADIDFNNLTIGNCQSNTPWFGVLYGAGGCGKTGIAKNAPGCFFVALEDGVEWTGAKTFLDANGKTVIAKDVNQVSQMLVYLYKNRVELQGNIHGTNKKQNTPIKTIVIDNVSVFQDLVYADVIAKHPTYGKKELKTECIADLGYDGTAYVMPYFTKFIAQCQYLKSAGYNVLVICHAVLANGANTDDGKQSKSFQMALQVYGQNDVPSMFKRSADFVYYVASEAITSTTGSGDWKRTVGTNSEVNTLVYTRETSLFYAKTRVVNMQKIPNSYTFNNQNADEVAAQIFNNLEQHNAQ